MLGYKYPTSGLGCNPIGSCERCCEIRSDEIPLAYGKWQILFEEMLFCSAKVGKLFENVPGKVLFAVAQMQLIIGKT